MNLLGASPVLVDLHDAWSWVVVVGNGVAGAWALGAHRVEALRHRSLWVLTAVAQISIFVQVALGVALIDGRPVDEVQFHMFYGFIAAFTVAIIYSYRAQLHAHRYLLYGFGGLFLMGLGIRNMVIPAV